VEPPALALLLMELHRSSCGITVQALKLRLELESPVAQPLALVMMLLGLRPSSCRMTVQGLMLHHR
jgi:hypothetical protein